MIYALDTNTISYILKGDESVIGRYMQENLQGNEFVIPPIVFYEIQRGLLAKNMLKRLKTFDEFCRDVNVGDFNINVWI